jgi:HSP90 family molecular chaperone
MVQRQIEAHLDSYVYIKGDFRPDTARLIQLLSGVELYGNPLSSVRELLQNGFDAVLEQMAYQRLRRPNPADPSLPATLGDLEHVTLRLDARDDGLWLICSDSGVGMTKAIIESSLLVSGKPQRAELIDLERRCLQHGFALGRTGLFGIGVLSYFMIADRLVIFTRRSQEAGDADATTWRFETAASHPSANFARSVSKSTAVESSST